MLRRVRRRSCGGFTLVEAALVLSLTGVVLAAFVPTFLRYVRTSKLAEATELLASFHQHAAAYYARNQQVEGLSEGACLPAGAGPYPATPSPDPVDVDFLADPLGAATWRALGRTAGPESLRYAYEVAVTEPGCRQRAASITFRALGDLDGDGQLSIIERSAVPAGDQQALVPRGPLRIVARTE